MTERTLFTGPNHRSLEEAAFAHAETHSESGVNRVCYISERRSRHDRIADRWREDRDPLALRTETLSGFVYDCYESLAGPAANLPDERTRRALEFGLDDVVEDRPWLSTKEYASAGLVDAFDRRFARIENVGLNTPERVRREFRDSPLPDRIAETTVEAYEAYHRRREAASEPWHTTYSEAFEAVSQADLGAVVPHVDVVVLSGFLDPSEVERAVLASIVDAFPTAAIVPTFSPSRSAGVDAATDSLRECLADAADFAVEPVDPRHGSPELQRVARSLYRDDPDISTAVPDALRWRELPIPEREVRYVAREVRTALAGGTDEADIGVVVPGIEAYEDYFADVFDAFGLPYDLDPAGRLTDTFVGSAVAGLVALADDRPRASDLTELLTNPVVGAFETDLEDAVVAAERRVDSVRVGPVCDALPAPHAETVRSLLDRLSPIGDGSVGDGSLDAATEAVRSALDTLRIAETIDGDDMRVDAGRERTALERVHRLLDSFADGPSTATDLPPLAALRRAIDGASIDERGGRPDAVPVLEPSDAMNAAFERLYVVGLTTDRFPSLRRHPAFFERMVDAHPRLDVLDERVRDRYVFSTMLANADAATLTTPETRPDASAVVRSPVLDELARATAIEPETGVDERVGSREDLQRALAPRDDRRRALDAAGDRGDLTVDQTTRADRGVACAAARSTPERSPRDGPRSPHDGLRSPHDGHLRPETVADVYSSAEREPYSASRIERYVNCGFRFYMEHVVGLADGDDVERTPGPLETGTYVHDTLERFFTGLQSEPGEAVDLRQYDRSDLEARMLRAAEDELAAADFAYSGPFYRRWLERFFAGLGDPESNPHYGGSRPHRTVERGLFDRFVEREHERDGDALPAWFEAPFGRGLRGEPDAEAFEIDLPNGESVEFRGYVDRIDVGDGDDGPAVRLFDYKTGSTPSMTETTGGTAFQLPLYLLAAEQVLDRNLDEFADISATYYQTKPPNTLYEPRGIESKFDSRRELGRFLAETVPERLRTLTDAIGGGRFHTTLLSASDAGCEHCAYRRSCDVRHHQRRDRIAEFDDDPRTYVPVRATGREFDAEFGGDADD